MPDSTEALPVLIAAAPGATLILLLTIGTSVAGLWRWPRLIQRCLLRPFWLIRRHQYHTLVTSGLVHADSMHLLFNGISFLSFAFALERVMGTRGFVGCYLSGLLTGSLGTWWRQRRNPNYASLGASGAVLAVLFAWIVYFPGQSLMPLLFPIPVPAPIFALIYLAYTYFAARNRHGHINHDAHLGGALAGLAWVAATDSGAWERALRHWSP